MTFGRYAGVTNAVGFDGLWSHDSLRIVVEVKTTDAYTIKAATLVGYVDALISEKVIPDWDHALGLYVVGRTDGGLQQLENAIVAERRMQQLRVATVESVLSLGELVQAQLLTLVEVVSIIRPTGVLVDDTVKLLSRVAAKPADLEPLPSETSAPGQLSPQVTLPVPARLGSPTYFLTPVSDDKEASAEQTIRSLLDQGWHVFGDTTPGRKLIKARDRICFYRSAVGVVASATVTSAVEKNTIKFVRNPDGYPWAFGVSDVRYFFDAPIAIDAAMRSQLDAFRGRDPANGWGWFVQGTRFGLSEHDFALLTGTASSG